MYCRKCGTHIPDDSVFCSKCGISVTEESKSEQDIETSEETDNVSSEKVNSESTEPKAAKVDGKKKQNRKKTALSIVKWAVGLSVFFAVALVLFFQAGPCFEYKLVDDDHYVITKYTGTFTEVTIPDTIWFKPVTSISRYAFESERGKPGVTCVKLGKNLTEIGEYAFKNCTSLEELDCSAVEMTGENNFNIKESAFENCTNLKKVTLPHSGITIGWSAFENCSALEEIITDEQDSLYTMEDQPFKATIGMYEKNNSIWSQAFEGCTSLKNLSLVNVSIGQLAFENCTGLTEMIMTGGSLGNLKDNELSIELAAQGKYNPGGGAFKNCTNLKTATIYFFSDYSKPITKESFFGCTALESVTGTSISYIGDQAFGNCMSLSELILDPYPSGISETAFKGCTKFEQESKTEEPTTVYHEYAATNFVGMPEKEAVKKLGNYRIFDYYGFDWYKFEDKGISFGVGQGTHRMELYEGAYVSSGYGAIDNVKIGMTVGEIFSYIGRQKIYMSEMDNDMYFFSYQCGGISLDFIAYSTTGYPDDDCVVSSCWVDDGYYD